MVFVPGGTTTGTLFYEVSGEGIALVFLSRYCHTLNVTTVGSDYPEAKLFFVYFGTLMFFNSLAAKKMRTACV